MFTPEQNFREWPAAHSEALKALKADGATYAEVAKAINDRFGTSYSRCACVGRGRRIFGAVPNEGKAERATLSPEERRFLKNKRKREKRWAENPDIIRRYGHEARAKSNRALFLARGATTTSAEYRRHVPRIRSDLSRADLRAMLTQAVQNTAAMVIA